MNTICIIQARLGSTRFPRKVLAKLHGKSMLDHVLERAREIRGVDAVVIGCPAEDADAISLNADVVFWANVPETDVLGRFALIAASLDADVIMRVTADCPLLDPKVSSAVLDLFHAEGVDVATNDVRESGYPDGFDTEVFSRALLERADRELTAPYDREHVTSGFESLVGVRRALLRADPPHPWRDLKLSVDTPEDLARVAALMARA